MLCPFDASELTVVNRSGIAIDWCPSCKGVWLERGELDKLIDLATGPRPPAPSGASPEPGYVPPPAGPPPAAGYPPPADPRWQQSHDGPRQERWYDDDDDHDDDDDDRPRRSGHRRKGKSLLSEIFDF